jgi:mono/diheme cytochrome c family protein
MKTSYRKKTPATHFVPAAMAVCALTLAGAPVQAAGDKAKGASLAQQWCNSCHTVMKDDSSRKFDAGPQFVDLAKKSEAYLRVAIDKPHDFMPKFPKLSRQDKADLVAHIQSLK